MAIRAWMCSQLCGRTFRYRNDCEAHETACDGVPLSVPQTSPRG